MAAYALALGANNFQIGLLASLPFITQMLQFPGVLLIEHMRMRKAIGVLFWTLAQLMWVLIALVPFLVETPGSLGISLVIVFLGIRGLFSPIVTIAWTSWMRDLVPHSVLGTYYGHRLALVTAVTAAVGLGGGYFIEVWQQNVSADQSIFGFSFLLLGGALTFGLASPILFVFSSEPEMPPRSVSGQSTINALLEAWRDPNFKQLIRFLFIWSLASNLAIPFFAVYMLTRLGMSLPQVIMLTVLSHVASIFFIRVWGPLADRLGSKTVLSLSSSLYLFVILSWTFTTFPERHTFTIPLLIVLHIFAGVAAGGVTLTAGTLNLKLAPDGKTTPYLAVASVATCIGQGLGPLLGGLFADFFSTRSLTIDFTWVEEARIVNLSALSLTGFDFLFVVAFLLGLASLNLLIALTEEGEVPRDAALRELTQASGAAMARVTSSVPGLNFVLGSSYGYLRRIPGFDVALGVTGYQLAASTLAAVESASRGRRLVQDATRNVARAVDEAAGQIETAADFGLELGRHATRGAVLAAGEASRVTRAAVVGTLRVIARTPIDNAAALEGVGYGAVEGALEAGEDPGMVVLETVEGARQVAEELGFTPDEAAATAVAGALEAAEAAGGDTLDIVKEALSEELLDRAEQVVESNAEAHDMTVANGDLGQEDSENLSRTPPPG